MFKVSSFNQKIILVIKNKFRTVENSGAYCCYLSLQIRVCNTAPKFRASTNSGLFVSTAANNHNKRRISLLQKFRPPQSFSSLDSCINQDQKENVFCCLSWSPKSPSIVATNPGQLLPLKIQSSLFQQNLPQRGSEFQSSSTLKIKTSSILLSIYSCPKNQR